MFNKDKPKEEENKTQNVEDNIYSNYMQNNNEQNNTVPNSDANNESSFLGYNENNNSNNVNNNEVNNNANNNQNNSNQNTNDKPTNTLETHTQITKASAISRFILVGFYLFAIIVGVVVYFMIKSNRYEFYLKQDSILLDAGSSYQIELIPKNERYFDYLHYNYSVADENVATVDEFGTVTAVGAGTTTLKISISPGFINTKTMKIISENINVETVEMGVYNESEVTLFDSINMNKDQSVTVKAVVNNRDDLNASAVYKSSNPLVATVDSFGNVTAKHDGTTTITGEVGGVVGLITVTVSGDSPTVIVPTTPKPTVAPVITPEVTARPNNPTTKPTNGATAKPTATPKATATPGNNATTRPTNTPTPKATTKPSSSSKVSLGIASQTTKYVGEELQLTATVDNKAAKSVTWSSSNVSVATISSSGLIKCKSAGTTVITATVNGVSGSATLIVRNKATATATPKATTKPTSNNATTPPIPASTIDKSHVTVSTNNVSVSKGSTKTFTISVINAAGSVSIKSSDTKIATVDESLAFFDGVDGKGNPKADTQTITITGKEKGTTYITIEPDDLNDYDTLSGVKGKHTILVTVN